MKRTDAATIDTRAISTASNGGRRRASLASAGAVFSAIAASSCCILPLALFGLGVGGAWIGNLTALAPYQPVFATAGAGFLGYGFYAVYWKPKPACADGATCDRPLTNRAVKTGLWTATALIAAALAFPYVAPRLLGV
ncbi:MAG: mercury transporter MerT [Rhodospirillales bacterium]|nr:mercury transporter MerT [Rhodospirillales bacterium]